MEAYTRVTGSGYVVMCIKGAKVLGGNFRNLKGYDRYNNTDGGTRYFNIQVDEDKVQTLKDFGCDVQYYEPYQLWHLKCIVSWKLRDPDVYVVASNGVRTKQTEQTIGDLDRNNNIDFVDMELSISHWKNPGREGNSTYASGVHFYLGETYSSEQSYYERFANIQPEPVQPVLPGMPEMEDDTPF